MCDYDNERLQDESLQYAQHCQQIEQEIGRFVYALEDPTLTEKEKDNINAKIQELSDLIK